MQPPAVWPPDTTRLAGADRYDTAVQMSKAAFSPGVPVVYVATGLSFPDGLSGAAAAAHEGGPLLLVAPSAIPSAVSAELSRLAPARIVVQGGPGVISDAVMTELATYTTGSVVRNAGADRYATALATSKRAYASAGTVYLASGATFPDALASSAAAAQDDAPMLLVPPGKVLPTAVSAELTRLNPTVVVILGGPGVVWPQVERALKSKVTTVARAGGVDRFGTAAITATGAFASADTALIATGSAFPDALAGGAYAATRGAPLFLVPGTCLPQYVIDELHYLAVSHVVVLGGTGVVSGAAAALTPCPAPSWLVKTNGWRADYGAGPVREDPEFSGDIAAHNFYMGKTGQYAHTEDPNNEWYTPHGALGGISADLAMSSRVPDVWMGAPFHAVSLLDPYTNVAGFASDVFSGEGTGYSAYLPVDPASVTWPKSWPSARRPLTLTALEYESPDPASGCPAAFHTDPIYPTAGLPLITSFGPSVSAITSASAVLTRNGSPLSVCVVRESNYVNADPGAQALGRAILGWNHHVFTIPKDPLTSGSYTLTVTTNVGTASTSFVVP